MCFVQYNTALYCVLLHWFVILTFICNVLYVLYYCIYCIIWFTVMTHHCDINDVYNISYFCILTCVVLNYTVLCVFHYNVLYNIMLCFTVIYVPYFKYNCTAKHLHYFSLLYWIILNCTRLGSFVLTCIITVQYYVLLHYTVNILLIVIICVCIGFVRQKISS